VTTEDAGVRSCLPLFHWRPDAPTYGITINFGDALFPLIVRRILGRDLDLVDESYRGRKFIPGGSLLHCARDGDVLWGVGLRTEEDFETTPRFGDLSVAAVRGPLTRDFLLRRYRFDVPETYGDPAILLPDLFPEWTRRTVKGRIGVVPHFRNRHEYPTGPEQPLIIWPDQAPEKVVADILTCELVLAGSLHGLIVAEAFGIPARWLNSSTTEPELKYYDYYQSTGRDPRPVKTIAEGERLGGERLPDLDTRRLLASFPRDEVCGALF
jgi:pyruvyltransferase